MWFVRNLFYGRINRANFVVGWVIFLVMYGASMILDYALPGINSVKYILQILLLIPALILIVSVYVRRLHDLGISGFAVLALIVPLLNLIYFIRCLCQSGASLPNRFGDPPTTTVRFPADLLSLPRDPLRVALQK